MSASTASLRPRTDLTSWCGVPRSPSRAASVQSNRKTGDWLAVEQTPTSPTLAAVPVPTGHPQRWLILGILCVCLVLVVASASSLNIAIPQIQKTLGATQTQIQWIVDAYALVFAGLLLPARAIGDRIDRAELQQP
ncbi:unannotated protein [freshwater metagenome]|uniref:Unannotated protein n=1 Tax=freshwater metagenome TaxID=449393 RepID=A0A6J7AIE1_9ZZZZ